MSSNIICKNCDKHYHGNYCPNCGQPAKTSRVDVKYFLHDIPHSIFHIDKGFLFTLKNMFLNPGKAIKEYLQGRRISHFKPFAFVLILSAICTILVPLIESLIKWQYTHNHPSISVVNKQLFWEKYISILIFILIPMLSLVTWITFRKKGFNYWEHFLGNTYLAAMVNVMYVSIKLWTLIKVFFGASLDSSFTVFMFAFMFYYSYSFKIWMKPNPKFWTIFFKLLIMNCVLATIYMTAFSLIGIMSPWWNF